MRARERKRNGVALIWGSFYTKPNPDFAFLNPPWMKFKAIPESVASGLATRWAKRLWNGVGCLDRIWSPRS
jgi:hypothetical protein